MKRGWQQTINLKTILQEYKVRMGKALVLVILLSTLSSCSALRTVLAQLPVLSTPKPSSIPSIPKKSPSDSPSYGDSSVGKEPVTTSSRSRLVVSASCLLILSFLYYLPSVLALFRARCVKLKPTFREPKHHYG